MTDKQCSSFHADTRLWVYGCEQELSEPEIALIAKTMDDFTHNWFSHGATVTGSYLIYHRWFVLVCGDCPTGISGCSIDSSVRVFKALRDDHRINVLNRDLIYYRSGDQVRAVDRDNFQQLIDQRVITPDTHVFNNLIRTVGDLWNNHWEIPLRKSWHAQAFSLSALLVE
jgi:hypothetical protein